MTDEEFHKAIKSLQAEHVKLRKARGEALKQLVKIERIEDLLDQVTRTVLAGHEKSEKTDE